MYSMKSNSEMRREEKVVEIDKAKGLSKRKYNKERIIKGQWIFSERLKDQPNDYLPVSARAADVT